MDLDDNSYRSERGHSILPVYVTSLIKSLDLIAPLLLPIPLSDVLQIIPSPVMFSDGPLNELGQENSSGCL